MRNKVQWTVMLPPDLAEWIDKKVESLEFANRAHGLAYCVKKCKDAEEEGRCRAETK